MLDSVRPRDHRPLRTLSLLAGGALILGVALLGPAARGDAPGREAWRMRLARADTDSVAVDTDSVALRLPDSLRIALGLDSLALDSLLLDSLALDSLTHAALDSLRADSIARADTNYRAERYLPSFRRDRRTASLFTRERRPFSAKPGAYWRHQLELDSTGTYYVAREIVGGKDVRYPLRVTPEQFRAEKLAVSLDRNWKSLAEQRARQREQQRRGGLGLNITVPGGRQSAFTTIFGKNEVDLRVTGQADIRAGFDLRKSDQQATFGQGSQVDPDFKQNLRLGVNGTIGDKMLVGVDWDTEREFDFQNQLKLQYTGYDDEILQSIEAGNVFLQTPSQLIRGGQSLFGVKSELKIGGVRVTTVASQQEGQSNNLSLEGGAETTTFALKPTDYDDRTHFFLSYYFRNRWEDALSEPPNLIIDGQFERITDIEVWKLQPVNPEEQNVRQVIALVDLGESTELLSQAAAFTRAELPSPDIDQYSDGEISGQLKPGDQNPKDLLESEVMEAALSASDYQVGQFKKLERGRDYTVDEILGYISLRQRMQESEALAVAFRYLANGSTRQVGDFSADTGGGDNSQNGDRLVLKLLRPVNLKQPANIGGAGEVNPAAWYLEMRNLYRLGRGIQPTEFELDVNYKPPGKAASKTLPGVSGQQTLIQVLGLDRLNEDGASKPDNRFDYLPNYSIIQGEGLLIFPYLEPFGNRVASLIEESTLPEADRQEAADALVFNDLYTQKKENARRNTQLDVYTIEGSFKGTIQSFYDLRAFSGLVPGSVRVTSGGTTLQEGTDYIVDYDGGTVTITNSSYLTAGRDIEIDYEQNALINLQKKTLLGARLEYGNAQGGDRLTFGSTVMRLSQKSLTDKFRIGEEPIANTIWGIDGALNLEPRWLTRSIDRLPLLQTKEPSAVKITGEFAQLRPGHTQTNAFKDTRRELRKDGLDFKNDELGGISYLDDFESFENTFTLMRPGSWLISGAPVTHTGEAALETRLDNTSRGVFGWYQVNATTLEQLGVSATDPAVGIVTPQQVFPNREATSQERTLTTFDVYFSPFERGPYNYTDDLGGFLDAPTQTWGGMTQRLAEGFTDFTLKNIEFVEFIFQPFAEGYQNGVEADPNAKLYVDLGLISEDVIPDAKLNTEDGLSLTEPGNNFSNQGARLSTGQQDQVINPIQSGSRITEDLGLDGLASFPDNEFAGTNASEQVQYRAFLDALNATSSTNPYFEREKAKALRDPSGDDYHYFLDENFYSRSEFYPGGSTVQQRFAHFFSGQELNSFEAQTKLADANVGRGNSRLPDSEDLNLNSTLDTEDSYFQYEMPLNLAALDELARPERVDDYVVEEIKRTDGSGTGWYLVRIPIKNFTRRIGDIQDFTLIESIRIWTQGHTVPMTMRFATLELVGSQWRKSESVSNETAGPGNTPLPTPVDTPPENVLGAARLSIESVNNEENDTYAVPNGTVVSQIRGTAGLERRDAREQSIVLRVEDLRPGQQQAIFQTYNTAHDLLKYNNLRMFAHLHGQAQGGRELEEDDRGKARLFVRLGANESNDYYEYEQPLTPSSVNPALISDEKRQDPDYLWRTNQTFEGEPGIDLNSMNIQLSALNQLKFIRDELGARTDSVFWNDENNVLRETVAGFAPPGTRIGIKGTPSLGRVNTIVIGVRNPDDPEGETLEDVVVWVNELRVSGYDELSGSAALLNADVQLADLGRVKANFRMQSDGFGDLSSTLGDRSQTNVRDWAVNTQINADKFIPERFGWAIPLSVEVKSNTSTPRFDPNRGDVRVEDLIDAIGNDDALSDEQKKLRQDEIVEQAQTYNFTRSFTARVQKSGSRSRLLRNTLDGMSMSYSFTDANGRTPTQEMRDSWRWSSTFAYRLAVRKPRTIRPFGFLGEIPVLNVLGGLHFNYLPSALNFSADANRRYSATKERPPVLQQGENDLPNAVEFPLRPQHAFEHGRQFGLQYNPFNFLNLSWDTTTDQSLNALGVDTLRTVILVDSLGQETYLERTSLDDLLTDGTIDSTAIGRSAFELENLEVRAFQDVLGDIFNGRAQQKGLRTETYQSRFNAAFRPRLERINALNWITIQDIGYGVQFSWRNGSVGNNTGATVGNSIDLRGGLTMRPQELFQKFGFYRKLEEQQKAADDRKAKERRDKENARQQRREERRRAREARRAAEKAGLPPPEEGNDAPEEGGDENAEETPQNRAETPRGKMIDGQPADADAPQAGEPDAPSDTTQAKKGGLKLPLPNPVGLLRRTFLGITGVRDLTINYNGNRRSDATNVGTADSLLQNVQVHYSLLDAFKGNGPSLGYRFGFDRSLDPAEQRILNDRLQVTDALSNTDRLQARTSINLSQSLRISLNWSVEQTDRESITYRRLDTNDILETSTVQGDNRASVWAFGASYLDLFTRQLETFRADARVAEDPALIGDENGDGRVVLTNEAVVDDFLATYLSGFSAIDGDGRLPFPMPNWQINYSGISNWPIIRRLTQSATLRHGYSADYNADFRSNLTSDSLGTFPLQAGGSIQFVNPDLLIGSVRVNERYQPLVGLDLSFKGNIQAGVAWNTGNTYSLSTTNNVVTETTTSEMTATLSYQRQGMRLPFMRGKRLNNRVTFSLTLSRTTNDDRTFSIRRAIEAAAANPDFEPARALEDPYVSVLSTTARFLTSPKISYQFSNRVSADVFLRYERFEGDSRRPSTTNVNGGFNVRVSIQS